VKIAALAAQDVRLTLRDGSAVFWIFVAPFLWVFFFGFMNRPPDPARARVALTVLRRDASPAAERLVELLKAENFGVRVIGPGDPPASGEDPPARALTIPEGFGGALAERRKVALDLAVTDRANPEGNFAVQIAVHRAVIRLLAGEAFGPLDPEQETVRVRSSWAGTGTVPAGYYQTIPGNLVMFVLIATTTYGSSLLVQERKNGLLRRLGAAPLSRAEILGGKLLGRIAVGAVQVGVFLAIGLAVFRIDWGSSPLGLAALLGCFIVCAAAIGFLAGTLFSSADAAAGTGVVLTLLMSALGGCWWPSEVMPGWLRTAGHAFPTAWAMDGLHQIISWGGSFEDVALPCAVLLAYALGAGAIAARRLRFAG
jgi:ABC-2 type transport system permease protein